MDLDSLRAYLFRQGGSDVLQFDVPTTTIEAAQKYKHLKPEDMISAQSNLVACTITLSIVDPSKEKVRPIAKGLPITKEAPPEVDDLDRLING